MIAFIDRKWRELLLDSFASILFLFWVSALFFTVLTNFLHLLFNKSCLLWKKAVCQKFEVVFYQLLALENPNFVLIVIDKCKDWTSVCLCNFSFQALNFQNSNCVFQFLCFPSKFCKDSIRLQHIHRWKWSINNKKEESQVFCCKSQSIVWLSGTTVSSNWTLKLCYENR